MSKLLSLLPLLFSLSAFSQNAEEQQILVQTKSIFSDTINVPEKVLANCKPLEKLLSDTIQLELSQKHLAVSSLELSDSIDNKYIIRLEIANILATGGGGWSGPKSIAVNTSIIHNDRLINSTSIASRGKGIPLQGTCGILENVVEDAAEKVAIWINKESASGFKTRINTSSNNENVAPLYLLVPALLDNDADIPEKIKQECNLEQGVVQKSYSLLNKQFKNLKQTSSLENAEGRLLTLTITGAHGAAGGSWSGSKGVTIIAAIIENGVEIETQRFSRDGGKAGIWGPIKGTCTILDSVTNILAKDVSNWVSEIETKKLLAADGASVHPFITADVDSVRLMAQQIFKSNSATQIVLDSAATRLISDMNNQDAVDPMAWLCKLLGQSKNARYTTLLTHIQLKAADSKLRKYAKKALAELSIEQVEQFIPEGLN